MLRANDEDKRLAASKGLILAWTLPSDLLSREAISAAIQLQYTKIDKDVIPKISKAKNEIQISNILADCRHKIDTL